MGRKSAAGDDWGILANGEGQPTAVRIQRGKDYRGKRLSVYFSFDQPTTWKDARTARDQALALAVEQAGVAKPHDRTTLATLLADYLGAKGKASVETKAK